MATRKKRSKSSSGWLSGLLAVLLLIVIGLIALSYLPEDAVLSPAPDAHRSIVQARRQLLDQRPASAAKAVPKGHETPQEAPTAPEPPRQPATASEAVPQPAAPLPVNETITVCSFNVQFLGSSKERDDEALASVVKGYDLVVVQELVAPPFAGTFPDGTPMKPDPQAAEFFDAMKANGFTYWLSEEDTGTGAEIHSNGTNTEWWVTFYKPEKVGKAMDLPHGFLADDRSDNPDFERVPYACSFRTDDSRMDFVLISVHLQPGSASKDKARRRHELSTIAAWVDAHDDKEKDFLILGDCNVENAYELREDTPAGFLSLNDECRATNTNVHGPKPYDHVFYRPGFTTEMDREFDMAVVDLVQTVKPLWKGPGAFPGDPYVHDEFRKVFSDHNPVVFRLKVPEKDDD